MSSSPITATSAGLSRRPLLMGKSRRKTLRSLQRYVHPSAEPVAAMTAAHDPAARRRQH